MLNTDFPPCEAKSLMAELSTRVTRGASRLWHVWNICCRNSSQNCIKNTWFPSIIATYLTPIMESRAWACDHETCRNGVLTVKSVKEMTIWNSVKVLDFRRVGRLVKSLLSSARAARGTLRMWHAWIFGCISVSLQQNCTRKCRFPPLVASH